MPFLIYSIPVYANYWANPECNLEDTIFRYPSCLCNGPSLYIYSTFYPIQINQFRSDANCYSHSSRFFPRAKALPPPPLHLTLTAFIETL
ncbi:hypothetical protein LENED_005584 [Lentinula edodes]|uniref:Uncharacterized protein n=1 Tax=Lentinula edodes TaxID=5353 RepID=A0A1Q3E9D1_LENED|nr:hypothetical protein LENED_005584 [Lentinula edodes]